MILAIDPGRDKSGLAVVDSKLNVYYRGIIPTREIDSYLVDLIHRYELEGIVLGNGTFSSEIEEIIKKVLTLPLKLVDESYTTIEAEKRYREEHFQQGWWRLIRFLNWKPVQPLDDYVAIILAERYWQDR